MTDYLNMVQAMHFTRKAGEDMKELSLDHLQGTLFVERVLKSAQHNLEKALENVNTLLGER